MNLFNKNNIIFRLLLMVCDAEEFCALPATETWESEPGTDSMAQHLVCSHNRNKNLGFYTSCHGFQYKTSPLCIFLRCTMAPRFVH